MKEESQFIGRPFLRFAGVRGQNDFRDCLSFSGDLHTSPGGRRKSQHNQ